jgi:hypothetical protein
VDDYNAITKRYDWPPYPAPKEISTTKTSKHYGVYEPALQLAVLIRDLGKEEEFGDIFTEAMLVHELAHGTAQWNEWAIQNEPAGDRVLSTKRAGQIVIERGEQHHAFTEEAFAAKVAADYLKHKGAKLDYESYADIAGRALDQFCVYDPRVFPALLHARSSVEGLREIPKLYNGLKPGLYSELQHTPYSEEGFTAGAKLLTDALAAKQQAAA